MTFKNEALGPDFYFLQAGSEAKAKGEIDSGSTIRFAGGIGVLAEELVNSYLL
jgi:hypothetical protein